MLKLVAPNLFVTGASCRVPNGIVRHTLIIAPLRAGQHIAREHGHRPEQAA
jgi:hypothetical protein